MRIGIDARFLTHPQRGGFKTYAESLIMAIAKVDSDNEYILYVDRQPLPTTPLPDQPNFRVRVLSGKQHSYEMAWREQWALPQEARRDHIDVFHSPCLTAPILLDVALVVTIHDMIWYHPARYSPNHARGSKRRYMELYYRWVTEIAARKANAIITVSNASKQCIIQYLRIPDDRVFVIYEATKSIFRPTTDKKTSNMFLRSHGLQSNYVLGVGSADPRKNIQTLIRAYAVLPEHLRQQYKLVIVWNHGLLASEAVSEAQKLGVTSRVLFLHNISDDDLIILYNQASLFVFPSLEEGFGLPPLEAMACGLPVVAADNSSIPEIVGDAALQFSAQDADGLAELMSSVLTNPSLRAEMSRRGIERAAYFSWEKCALETIKVYKTAVPS